MLPPITKGLLMQYLVLLLILAPATFFIVMYHLSLPKEASEEESEPTEKAEEQEATIKKAEKPKKADIHKLYADIKKKYDPSKAGDKKTRLRNKQIMLKVEKAYKLKDIKTLQSF